MSNALVFAGTQRWDGCVNGSAKTCIYHPGIREHEPPLGEGEPVYETLS